MQPTDARQMRCGASTSQVNCISCIFITERKFYSIRRNRGLVLPSGRNRERLVVLGIRLQFLSCLMKEKGSRESHSLQCECNRAAVVFRREERSLKLTELTYP